MMQPFAKNLFLAGLVVLALTGCNPEEPKDLPPMREGETRDRKHEIANPMLRADQDAFMAIMDEAAETYLTAETDYLKRSFEEARGRALCQMSKSPYFKGWEMEVRKVYLDGRDVKAINFALPGEQAYTYLKLKITSETLSEPLKALMDAGLKKGDKVLVSGSILYNRERRAYGVHGSPYNYYEIGDGCYEYFSYVNREDKWESSAVTPWYDGRLYGIWPIEEAQ